MTLRVAFVGGYPPRGRPPEGGVEIATSRLVLALAEAGVEVTTIAPGQPGGPEAEPARIVRIPVDMRLSLLRGLRPWRSAVAGALTELEPAIVHAHGLVESGIAAIDAGLPSVVSVHGNHAMDTRAARKDLGGEARVLLTRRLALRVVRRADAVVSVHPSPEINLPARPTRFVYIPTIVDDAFRSKQSSAVAGRVLFCGGARRIKGLDLLAAAWPDIVARVPGASLEIVGWPDAEQLPDGLRRCPGSRAGVGARGRPGDGAGRRGRHPLALRGRADHPARSLECGRAGGSATTRVEEGMLLHLAAAGAAVLVEEGRPIVEFDAQAGDRGGSRRRRAPVA